MKTLISDYKPIHQVTLPNFKNRQKYMHSFELSNPKMANGFEDYLGVVSDLCLSVGAINGIAHMTVDEKIIEAGMSQRKPNPHVDGCYYPDLNAWGSPGWLHFCNNFPNEDNFKRMSIIVVSDVPKCKVWRGNFDVEPKLDGDLSHVTHLLGVGEILPANVGYLLSADCIHESMRVNERTQRTFLRIALPVTFNGFADRAAGIINTNKL
jgi:hypothetical protein